MWCRLFVLVIVSVFTNFFALCAEDFESDIPAKVTFSETYNDTIVKDPDFDYLVIPETTLKVTVVCSMKGVDLSSLNADTSVSIDFGGLSGLWSLGDDPAYRKGNTTASIPLLGSDPITGDEVKVGKVTLVWDKQTVTITLTAQNDPLTYQVMAADAALSGEATPNYDDISSITVTFGDRELPGRNVYVHGTLSYEDYQQGDIEETLAHVVLSGELDSTPPTLQLLQPQVGEKTRDRNYTVSGIASDEHGISAVFVKLNSAPEQQVTLSPTGAWSLPVTLNDGINIVDVWAIDQDDNVTTLSSRAVTVAPLFDLKVTAEGTGDGQVSSDFFPTFTYTPGVASPESVTQHETGELIVITASPAPNALFDGWISSVPLANPRSPRISVAMQPGLTLSARFVPNVFLPVRGSYSGLLESSAPAGRGSVLVKLGPDGTFSAKITLGTLTMRLKGAFGTDGKFTGTAAAGKQLFDVTLALSGLESATKQITGSFQPHVATNPPAPSFQSTITADLGVFKKRHREVSSQLTGSYNVLISPAVGNTDPAFPVGIGFGRVTLSRFGTAKFAGKLGDGTAVTAASPISEDASWSLYAPLVRKNGALIGRVKFDPLQVDSDISGVLNCSRPPSREPVHGEGFAGQVQLAGAKYVKRAAGERVFLNPTGAGQLSLKAPSARGTPAGSILPELTLSSAVTLSSSNQLTAINTALAVRGNVNPATGLFTGSFFDATVQKRVFLIGVVVVGGTSSSPKGNVVGGFFTRGNRTGSVQIAAASTLPPL